MANGRPLVTSENRWAPFGNVSTHPSSLFQAPAGIDGLSVSRLADEIDFGTASVEPLRYVHNLCVDRITQAPNCAIS